MRGPHEAAPDFDRQAAADRPLGRRIVVIAEPDAGDETSGVADEPGVAEILAGAGLARGLPAGKIGRRARPPHPASPILWFSPPPAGAGGGGGGGGQGGGVRVFSR